MKHLANEERVECLGRFRTMAGEAETWALGNNPKLVDDPYCIITYVRAHLGTWDTTKLEQAQDACFGARFVRDAAKKSVLIVAGLASFALALVAIAVKPYAPEGGFLAAIVGLGFVALGAGREIVRTLGYDLESERLKQWQNLAAEVQKSIISRKQP